VDTIGYKVDSKLLIAICASRVFRLLLVLPGTRTHGVADHRRVFFRLSVLSESTSLILTGNHIAKPTSGGTMDVKDVLTYGAGLVFVLGPLLVIVERLKSNRSPGARTIQFLCVMMTLPAILILSLTGVISGETAGTLLGALIGYILSGVGDYRPGQSNTGAGGGPGNSAEGI